MPHSVTVLNPGRRSINFRPIRPFIYFHLPWASIIRPFRPFYISVLNPGRRSINFRPIPFYLFSLALGWYNPAFQAVLHSHPLPRAPFNVYLVSLPRPLPHHAITFFLPVTKSRCHFLPLLRYHAITLSRHHVLLLLVPCHSFTRHSPRHEVTQSRSHFFPLPLLRYHAITLSRYHFLLPCHDVTKSRSHEVTMSRSS